MTERRRLFVLVLCSIDATLHPRLNRAGANSTVLYSYMYVLKPGLGMSVLVALTPRCRGISQGAWTFNSNPASQDKACDYRHEMTPISTKKQETRMNKGQI